MRKHGAMSSFILGLLYKTYGRDREVLSELLALVVESELSSDLEHIFGFSNSLLTRVEKVCLEIEELANKDNYY